MQSEQMPQNIDSIKRKALARYPYFASVADKVDPGLYESTSFEEMTLEEQVFAYARALCHAALEHSERGRGKDPAVWKAASEAVVNQWLMKDGLKMEKKSLDYPEAIEYDVEDYYLILLEEKLAIEMIEQNMLHQEGSDEEGETSTEEGSLEDLEEPEETDEDQEDEDSEDDDEDEELIEVIESRPGNDDSPSIRELDTIGDSAPSLDWRLLLRDSIRHGVDWSMQHAVIEDGIVRPILEELPIPETEIVIDTSWSVDEELLRNFLRQCKNILRLSKMRAGCFDTVFYGFNDIRCDEDIDRMEFPGGGGTDFNVAAEAFTMRADNRIIFTDGEADDPEKTLNAIWVVYGEKQITPPGGTVIHIPYEQL